MVEISGFVTTDLKTLNMRFGSAFIFILASKHVYVVQPNHQDTGFPAADDL